MLNAFRMSWAIERTGEDIRVKRSSTVEAYAGIGQPIQVETSRCK